MTNKLIRLDHKHIFVEQMKMLIENYLREADFWHVVNIGRGASWTQNSSARS